jgi:RNA polymerase sigma-70 factor, ECF subfamily
MGRLEQHDDQVANPDSGTALADIVKMAAAGDRGAFEGLIARFQGDIFRMVYYRTSSRMDAEDITQEIFVNAYRGVKALKDPEMFRSWLYRIALNAVRDFYRKKRLHSIFTFFSPQHEEEHASQCDSSLDHLEKKQFWDRLGTFLSRLSEAEKEVFRLRYLDGLGIREVSDILGKNESTVKTHLYRAVDKFRKEQELCGFPLEEKL